MIALAELMNYSWCFKQGVQGTEHNILLEYEHRQKWKCNFLSLLCSSGLNLNESSPSSRQLWWGVWAGRIKCTLVMHPLYPEKGYGMNGLHLLLLSLCHRSFPLPEELSAPRSSLCVLSPCIADPPGGVFTAWESLISAIPQSPIWEGFRDGISAAPKLRVLVCQCYSWTGKAVLRYSKFLPSYTCFTFSASLRWYKYINSKVLTKILCLFY